MEQIKNHVQHEFEPVYDEYSQILILGTLPSVKSRENHFYYGHPQEAACISDTGADTGDN